MTGIDFIIIILLLSGILTGVTRGFIGGIIDIIGIIGGVSLASIAYRGPVILFKKFNIEGIAVDILFFHLFSFLFIISIIVGIEVLRKRVFIKHIIDKTLGLITGTILGMFLSGFFMNIISASPISAQQIDNSKYTKYITRFVPKIYEKSDKIGINLPKLFAISDTYEDEWNKTKLKISFLKINFVKIKGTCIKCKGEVEFSGYFIKSGMSVIPKFICRSCGRTSDGCQSFEIFHLLYKKCPVELAKKGIMFDCPNFPNHEMIMPKGSCPVDKNELKFWELKPPIIY